MWAGASLEAALALGVLLIGEWAGCPAPAFSWRERCLAALPAHCGHWLWTAPCAASWLSMPVRCATFHGKWPCMQAWHLPRATTAPTRCVPAKRSALERAVPAAASCQRARTQAQTSWIVRRNAVSCPSSLLLWFHTEPTHRPKPAVDQAVARGGLSRFGGVFII